MSSFPPKQWQVRYLKDLDSMTGTINDDQPISMEAMMAIQPSDGEEGSFRFVLAGPQHLMTRTKISTILPGKEFENMYLCMQLELGTQVKTEKNSVASKWIDIENMILAQDADVTDQEGEEINEVFLSAFEEYKKKMPVRSGIAIKNKKKKKLQYETKDRYNIQILKK